VAIDDVQWLDPATASALEFAARRAGDIRVRYLITRRSDGYEGPPLGLVRGFGDDSVRVIRISPLLRDELDSLLRSRLDLQLSRARLVELHRTSGGNPLYALEIAAAAERQGLLAGRAALGVPGSLGDLLRERLSELSPQALDAILLVATSSQATSWLIEKAAGGSEGLDEAIREAVLEVDGERLRFTHPLIGSVAYGLASPTSVNGHTGGLPMRPQIPRRRPGSSDSARRRPTRPSPRFSRKPQRQPPPAEARRRPRSSSSSPRRSPRPNSERTETAGFSRRRSTAFWSEM
jgi:hypothetical protein